MNVDIKLKRMKNIMYIIYIIIIYDIIIYDIIIIYIIYIYDTNI